MNPDLQATAEEELEAAREEMKRLAEAGAETAEQAKRLMGLQR